MLTYDKRFPQERSPSIPTLDVMVMMMMMLGMMLHIDILSMEDYQIYQVWLDKVYMTSMLCDSFSLYNVT